MARMLKWLGMATLSFALTGSLVGCVPQEKYAALRMENEAKTEALSDALKDAAANQQEALAYKTQNDKLADEVSTLSAIRTNDEKQISDFAAQNGQLSAQLKDADTRPPTITEVYNGGGAGNALPAQLSNALSDFANANPGLVEFDSAHGIVKFKSDVTFPTGSSELTADAKAVIDKFAIILNSPAAGEYELLVAGHTDSVPVNNPQTIRQGNKNNLYLSAHRAISVASELIAESVNKGRIGVAGYGEERPIADNGTAAGRKMNRRVEVLILPTRHMGRAIQAAATESPAPRHVAPAADANKDGGMSPDAAPAFNK
jgi:flagellar motor protein MotB